MKPPPFILVKNSTRTGVFFLLFCGSLVLSCRETTSSKPNTKPVPKADCPPAELLREGDIILRRGYGTVSNFIASIDPDTVGLSHCGLIVLRNDRWLVVSSLSSAVAEFDGVQTETMEQFCQRSRPGTVFLVRKKDLSEEKGKAAAKLALRWLDQKIPFDYSLNMLDSSAFYCSELVWRALNPQGLRLPESQPVGYLPPSAFLDSVHYDRIFPLP